MRGSLSLLFVIAAVVAAGCSGGSAGSAAPGSGVLPAQSLAAARPADCGGWNSHDCGGGGGSSTPTLVAPLQYAYGSFSEVPYAPCTGLTLDSAPQYAAPSSGTLSVSGKLVLTPVCSPSPSASQQLEVVGVQVSTGKNPQAQGDYVVVATISSNGEFWNATLSSPGLTMTAGDSYEFFVAIGSTATPAPARYAPVAPLDFDGTSFSLAADRWGGCDWFDQRAYDAKAGGALTLSADVTLSPANCVPEELIANQSLYIVAVQLHDWWGGWHSPAHKAHDWGWGFPATAIAGPATSAGKSGWDFAPDSPGLTFEAGAHYLFFVAVPVSDDQHHF